MTRCSLRATHPARAGWDFTSVTQRVACLELGRRLHVKQNTANPEELWNSRNDLLSAKCLLNLTNNENII